MGSVVRSVLGWSELLLLGGVGSGGLVVAYVHVYGVARLWITYLLSTD